jgi:hypothetical protein
MRSLGRAEWPSGTDEAVPRNHWEPLQHVLDRERLCIKIDGKRNQPLVFDGIGFRANASLSNRLMSHHVDKHTRPVIKTVPIRSLP